MQQPDTKINGHYLSDMRSISMDEALSSEQTFLRLAYPSEETLNILAERFGLDELHIRDVSNPIHPPVFAKIHDTCTHIILRFPITPASDEVVSTSLIFDAKTCVLVWPQNRLHIFKPEDIMGLSVHATVAEIIHTLVDYLLTCVYAKREQMNDAEDDALDDINNADLSQLLMMRRQMSRYARLAHGNAIVIERLLKEEIFQHNIVLMDASEHMERAKNIADARAEHALIVLQAAQSLLSQNLNQVMMFLAIITVILTPMGVIAGIFGMNFAHMEVLNAPLGFALTIWGMVLLAVITGIVFKIKKWW